MDKQLIEEKLESLRRCVKRIEGKCPESGGQLASDADLQDIIAVNLIRAVQLCVDIAAHLISETEARPPGTMAESFDTLADLGILDAGLATRMKKSVGFRNIAVHSYQAVDWQIVFSIARHNLRDFSDFARAVAKTL